MRSLILSVVLVMFAGCWSKVDYRPQPIADRGEALRLLERLLWEQRETPDRVEVASDRFIVGTEGRQNYYQAVFRIIPGRDDTRAIYFDRIAAVELYESKNSTVVLKDSEGRKIYQYFTASLENARKFVDVIEAVRRPA